MTSELEWRRRWKLELRCKPWQTFTIDGEKFLIKAKFADDCYEILISDYTNVWYEKQNADGINRRSKKLNPGVEAPPSKLLEHISKYAESQKPDAAYSVAFKELEDDQQKILITLETKLVGLPFVWKFNGEPAQNDMISNHIVIPLLVMVGELQRQEQELYKLLKNKDKEIEDLKSQGVRCTRRHLETPRFDEIVFKSNMTTSKMFEEEVRSLGRSGFTSEGQELYQDVMTKHAYINREKLQAAEGESLMEEEAGETSATVSGQSWNNRIPGSIAGSSKTSSGMSPQKGSGTTPTKSPARCSESSHEKEYELRRRRELESKLQEEEKKQLQAKKKKKIKF